MTKQEVTLGNGTKVYYRPKDLQEGQVISGVYQGSEIDGFDNLCHNLTLDDGSLGVVNGSGKLNKLLEKVEPGTAVEIIYKGKTEMTSGKWAGIKAHDFQVFTKDLAATGSTKSPF